MHKSVVPLKDRPINEVDEMQAKIARIQDCCEHNFRFLRKPKIRESLVPGVFILSDAQFAAYTQASKHIPSPVEVKCLSCNKVEYVSVFNVCPECLSKLEKVGGLRLREEFYGCEHTYYAAQPLICPSCGFKGVKDVWDR